MKHNLNEHINLLLEYIDASDVVCVGAAAGYDCVYHNDKYLKKYLGVFGRKYGFAVWRGI